MKTKLFDEQDTGHLRMLEPTAGPPVLGCVHCAGGFGWHSPVCPARKRTGIQYPELITSWEPILEVENDGG